MKLANTPKSLLAGAAGAIALTALHESARQVLPDPPRMDKLGEQAIERGLHAMHLPSPHGQSLHQTALVGDLVSNALFYALVGKGRDAWIRGTFLGLLAGVGAVFLPDVIGLDSKYSADSKRKGLTTIGYYLFGGLIAAGIARLVSRIAD